MDNIIIPNPEELEKTIEKIKKDGPSKLHIVSDFDRTLTKTFVKGEKTPTINGQMREGGYLGDDYIKRSYELYDLYHPMEIDSKIPLNEKIKKMHEWWKSHFDLLIKSKMNKDIILDIVKKRKITFREKALDILDILYHKKIPLLIMSASIGDITSESLKFAGKNYDNIILVANMLIWDKSGYMVGVKEPIIHSVNKHEIQIKSLPIYTELLKRKNIILLGDNIDDLGMVEGFPYKNIIKIGFLNEDINKTLEEFKNKFDVIITNDSDMSYVYELMKKIIG
jgi:cytosolic 5'-nucleotidase 3